MDDDLQLALRAARAGAAVGLRHFRALAPLARESKADGSVVTAADRAVEATVREVLAAARPCDAVLGEEGGQTGDGDRRWIVDPIDGTAQFVTGDDRWLVLVALQQEGETVVGVAAVPAQDTVWWAQRGRGAWRATLAGAGKVRIRTARDRGESLTGSRLGVVPVDEQVRPAERDMIAGLTAVTTVTAWPTHAALLVAAGELDLAVQTRGELWDFASTALIVEEAGGRYSGLLDGRRQPGPGPSLFARTAALHTAALAAVSPDARS
jgi:histidinol-phosphatase